jgi:predicted DsbA family dithiol-disulfide isomerase
VSAVTIRHFTDPGCPFAFSAERRRLRLLWLYGDQVAWELHMAVLREEKEPEWTDADQWRDLHRRYGMPLDWRSRAWNNATVHACRAVVAVRLRWPEHEERFLRRLRVLAMAGALLDDSDTLELAAGQAGLPVADLAAYCAEPAVDAALRAGTDGAPPSPTYEILGDGDAIRVQLSGLPAIETAERALEQLAPELQRRPDPRSADEVLAWAQMPLATAEVAAVCDRDLVAVRAELARTARFEPVGADGYWSPA